jgi:hypothetical protein
MQFPPFHSTSSKTGGEYENVEHCILIETRDPLLCHLLIPACRQLAATPVPGTCIRKATPTWVRASHHFNQNKPLRAHISGMK